MSKRNRTSNTGYWNDTDSTGNFYVEITRIDPDEDGPDGGVRERRNPKPKAPPGSARAEVEFVLSDLSEDS